MWSVRLSRVKSESSIIVKGRTIGKKTQPQSLLESLCNIHNTYLIHLQLLIMKYISVIFIVSVLNTKSFNNDHRDGVVMPGLDHPVHQLPLSGEGVELQDFIKVGGTVSTALISNCKSFH